MRVVKAPADGGFQHARKAAVLAELAKLADGGAVEFAAIRAALAVTAAQLPDGVLHQLAIDAGYRVEP